MPFAPNGGLQTLSGYRTSCRRLLADSTGKFWSDAELNDYINDGRFRVAADTACLRKLVSAYLSTGLEVYNIGGVTGGLVTNPGSGYTNATVTVLGDGTGATATATLSTPGTPSGGTIMSLVSNPGTGWTVQPTVSITGNGSGAAATAYFTWDGTSPIFPFPLGSNYNVGDLLTLVAPGALRPMTFRVCQVGGGGALSLVVVVDPGLYSVAPNPFAFFSVTGGSGSGAMVQGPACGVTALLTNPGSGYSNAVVSFVGGDGSNALVAPILSPIVGSNGVAQIVVTNPGTNYTFAQFIITGNGTGAAATATVIPATALDIMNVSPIWGSTRPPCNYMPFTEFNAKARNILQNPGLPRLWSRYGSSGGSAYLSLIPDQPYLTEFDMAIQPPTLVADTDTDSSILYPYSQPVPYYASWKAKLKQQAFAEAAAFLEDYKREVMMAQAAIMMRRIPNPYAGYSGG